ncbi:hypothetical protein [Flavobacterium subsaxonicum]|uniref:hypothetical protein n=1 Tax=Flavobacterium subsaxonicum TaxID=426226 RepID=UPI0004047500|nr:hypothetical protein [Flavobacterium subsaxonicum]
MNAKKVVLLVAIALLVFSCKRKDDYDELLKKIEINPAFEKSPPIAKNVFFEALEKPLDNGNNMRFIAQFDKDVIRGRYLALLLDDKKVVLRDDGKFADKKANDNQFSVFLKEDLGQFKQEIAGRQKAALDNDRMTVFKNRQMLTLNTKELHTADLTRFTAGRIFRIPPDIFRITVGLTDPAKTLLINEVSVVEDPARTFNPCTGAGTANGVWTFGALMRQMASPNPGAIATDAQVSDFVIKWLNTWQTNQTINGEDVPARATVQNTLLTPWLNASQAAGAPNGELKMELAPFKLLAIVNRMDLRGNSGYGFSNAGEGRFVFSAMGANCSPLQFTVIFEYGINKSKCSTVKDFAREWHALDALATGSAAYNNALEHITMQFTQSGTNVNKPNQNSINQIRTDDFLTSPWELREFNLADTGLLVPATVKQEPAKKYNAKINNADVQRLITYVNNNSGIIVNNNYEVPEQVPLTAGTTTPTTAFLGGKAHTMSPGHFWNGTATAAGGAFITSDEARHIFSFNTCSGCHGGETNTFFTHVKPAPFGSKAQLSGFLTGITVTDAANRPTGAATVRTFNDLERRRLDLTDFINNRCTNIRVFDLAHVLTFTPVRMTH